jgi:alpha-1,2-mannosyltransferase
VVAPVLTLMCVAMFGLVVSPVSWSHHWVWVLPTLVVCGVLAWRWRSVALAAVSAVGLALMIWTPIDLLPEHQEAQAAWWRQVLGGSYVWWALAVVLVTGIVSGIVTGTRAVPGSRRVSPQRTPEGAPESTSADRSARALHHS